MEVHTMSFEHYRPRLLFPSYLPSCRPRPSRSFPGMSGQYGQSYHTDSIPVNLRQTKWHLQARGSLWTENRVRLEPNLNGW